MHRRYAPPQLRLWLAGALVCGATAALAQDSPGAGPEPERECRTLKSGDTFCAVSVNGHTRWVLQGKLRERFEPGDPFPIYEQSMIMDLNRYDLPPVDGPWRYYIFENVIYKVSSETGTVIEKVKRYYRR